jgi:hypothetical protein
LKSGLIWFCRSDRLGSACALEGLLEALSRFLPDFLVPAVAKKERISFRQVNKQTGNRLRQKLIDTITGEAVARDQKGRGYEVGEDQFLLVRDDELAAAEEEARHRPYTELGATTLSHQDQGSEAPISNSQETTTILEAR